MAECKKSAWPAMRPGRCICAFVYGFEPNGARPYCFMCGKFRLDTCSGGRSCWCMCINCHEPNNGQSVVILIWPNGRPWSHAMLCMDGYEWTGTLSAACVNAESAS